MPLNRILCAAVTTTALTINAGCSTLSSPPETASPTAPASLYDSTLIASHAAQAITLTQLGQELAGADVVIIGEYHGHQASHLLQSRVQQQLHSRNPRQVLTLEQFNLDHQAALDAYLAGESGEQELIEDANAWDNYQASYRPLVELARDHGLPVIAANAPADTVRCVGQVGPAYLAQLPEAERQALPAEPFLDTPAYREKFNNAISRSHGQGDPGTAERMEKIYQAQLLRDNTMATQILNARERFPGYQILHLTGNFHSEQGLGTVALLKQRAPELSIQVLSPVFWLRAQTEAPLADNLDKGDYLYLIRPLPPEYRNEDRQRKAMQERFSKRPDVRCEAD